MDTRLNGQRALVCGSTQGIGKATAMELARSGAHVTLLARDEEKLRSTVAELDRSHGQDTFHFAGGYVRHHRHGKHYR